MENRDSAPPPHFFMSDTSHRKITAPANSHCRLDTPPGLQANLTRYGGRNFYGEPCFRVVWGWNRLELVYSRKSKRYAEKPRYYRQRNRWIVEAYHPPPPKAWWEMETRFEVDGYVIDALGPYPSRGEYEYLWHADTPHAEWCEVPNPVPGGDGVCVCGGGGYVALNARLCEVLVDMVKLSRGVHWGKRRDWHFDQQEKKERDFDRIADAAIEDAGRPFGGNYFVPMRGQSPDYWPKNPEERFNVT